jgi:ferredoxin
MSILIYRKTAKVCEIPCYRDLNLLAHAQVEEIELGSLCGGHGICGGDLVRVIDGSDYLSEPSESEKKHISKDKLGAGWRLACQAWPDSNGRNIKITL